MANRQKQAKEVFIQIMQRLLVRKLVVTMAPKFIYLPKCIRNARNIYTPCFLRL